MLCLMVVDVLHYLGDFSIAGFAVHKRNGAQQRPQLAYITAAVAAHQQVHFQGEPLAAADIAV